MHTDARTLDEHTRIEGDICIIGSGAAGLSIALEWIGSRHKVIVLEGGGFDYDLTAQDRFRGENVGQRYFPMEACRLHQFGGTTGHWAGFCTVLDPIDLKPRPWVPHSGWPFTREALDPFYARAHPILELGPYTYALSDWQREEPGLDALPLDPDTVWTKLWQFSPPTRFRLHYRDAIVDAPNVHLYTHAAVCNITAHENATAVRHLDVRTPEGKRLTVQARHYVLACGAIQNARLLLASNGQAPQGLGNDHDLVGRYFMEHPEVRSAMLAIQPRDSMKLYGFSFGQRWVRGELALSEAQQAEHQILNGTASLWPGASVDRPDLIDTFDTRRFQRLNASNDDLSRPDDTPPESLFLLMTRLEQAPNPNSRVMLSEEKDALGVPRVRLDWQLTTLDRRSIRTLYEIIAHEVGRAGVGRIQLLDWLQEPDDAPWPSVLAGGWHHMGTTRMHDDPRQGVVDRHGQVHGIDNLHVAGASVFPTAGSANPTLTIVALALRLSDHLKAKVT